MQSFLANERKSWTAAVDAGVLPAITGIDEYNRKINENCYLIYERLKHRPVFITTGQDVREIHRLLFNGITPWAGQFSKLQMAVGGRIGAPYSRADREFELLGRQLDAMVPYAAASDDPIMLVRLVAFSHAKFEAIHIFPDGNGRVGRIVAGHALNLITGHDRLQSFEKRPYIDALKAAQDDHNLAPLSDLFAKAYLGYGETIPYLPAPFRIPPFFESDLAPIETDLERSVRDNPSLIATRTVPVERCWLRGIQWKDLERLVHGRPGPTYEAVRTQFEEQRGREMSLGQAIKLLADFKRMAPFKGKSLFRKPKEEGWNAAAIAILGPVETCLKIEDRTTLHTAMTAQLHGEDRIDAINSIISDCRVPPATIHRGQDSIFAIAEEKGVIEKSGADDLPEPSIEAAPGFVELQWEDIGATFGQGLANDDDDIPPEDYTRPNDHER